MEVLIGYDIEHNPLYEYCHRNVIIDDNAQWRHAHEHTHSNSRTQHVHTVRQLHRDNARQHKMSEFNSLQRISEDHVEVAAHSQCSADDDTDIGAP
jgi:hypothetical protein